MMKFLPQGSAYLRRVFWGAGFFGALWFGGSDFCCAPGAAWAAKPPVSAPGQVAVDEAELQPWEDLAPDQVAIEGVEQPLVSTPVLVTLPRLKAKDWLNSDEITIEELKGNYVVLEFWKTTSKKSQESLSLLKEIWAKYQSGPFALISVTEEKVQAVKKFLQGRDVHWPVACGSKSAGDFNVPEIPYAFLIGKDGKILWQGSPLEGLADELAAIFPLPIRSIR
jgi:hypothetical protein